MAVAFDSVIAVWGGGSAGPQASGSFNPTTGRTIIVGALDTAGTGKTLAYTGTVNTPTSKVTQNDPTDNNTAGLGEVLSATTGSQTVSVNSSPGGDAMCGYGIIYSGVSSTSYTSKETTATTTPVGIATTVASGSILLALCIDVGGFNITALTGQANGGVTPTDRASGTNLTKYTWTEYVGTGGSITPTFSGISSDYLVLQVLLTGAAATASASRSPQDQITLWPAGQPMAPVAAALGKTPTLSPVRFQNWESYPWGASSTSVPGAGRSSPSANVFGSAAAAFAAAGMACAASIAFASGTVTYAAAGISNPSSVLFGNEGETDVENGVAVASSVAFGSATVAYAASGIAAPSLVATGNAASALAAAGLSNPSLVSYGDLAPVGTSSPINGLMAPSLVAMGGAGSAGQLDGRSIPSLVVEGDARIAGQLDGRSVEASIVLADAGVTGAASGLTVAAAVAYGDLQLLPAGAINGLSVGSSVFYGDISYDVATATSTGSNPAGRRRRYRGIYRVTIDGESFEFKTYEAACEFLDKAKEAAQKLVDKALAEAVASQRNTPVEIPLPKMPMPVITASSRDLRAEITKTKQEISKVYEKAAQDIEFAVLLELAVRKRENEEIIFWLH